MSPLEQARRIAALAQEKLAELVNLGFVLRENGILTSRLAFKDGQFTVNGKPFSPVGQAQ